MSQGTCSGPGAKPVLNPAGQLPLGGTAGLQTWRVPGNPHRCEEADKGTGKPEAGGQSGRENPSPGQINGRYRHQSHADPMPRPRAGLAHLYGQVGMPGTGKGGSRGWGPGGGQLSQLWPVASALRNRWRKSMFRGSDFSLTEQRLPRPSPQTRQAQVQGPIRMAARKATPSLKRHPFLRELKTTYSHCTRHWILPLLYV